MLPAPCQFIRGSAAALRSIGRSARIVPSKRCRSLSNELLEKLDVPPFLGDHRFQLGRRVIVVNKGPEHVEKKDRVALEPQGDLEYPTWVGQRKDIYFFEGQCTVSNEVREIQAGRGLSWFRLALVGAIRFQMCEEDRMLCLLVGQPLKDGLCLVLCDEPGKVAVTAFPIPLKPNGQVKHLLRKKHKSLALPSLPSE
jgi:hypothetical protein